MKIVAFVHDLVAVLDSPGGHLLILMTLIAAGILLQTRGHEGSGKELTSGALGALFAVLRYQAKEVPTQGGNS